MKVDDLSRQALDDNSVRGELETKARRFVFVFTQAGGFTVMREEWPSAPFEHIEGEGEANVISEVIMPRCAKTSFLRAILY
jgi:hypothetical protein